ncbi:hypothetical protein [Azohydromonas sediminis]|uniref:hypothetical protein n=1 Tax=Azohydromonas sediminis TaxID=2259674 RepID=UPI000E654742|nr:hypothetical protein [Azohydromonas sediminis]
MVDHNTVLLRVTRPTVVGGARLEVGAQVTLSLHAALDAVETQRLAFVDPADRERCMQARRQQIARQLRSSVSDLPPGPWLRVA